MNDTSAPIRTCVGCRAKRPQHELVRSAMTVDGSPVVSRTAHGRGAWLCAGRTTCLQLAERRRGFERAWKRPIGSTQIEKLKIAYEAMKTNMEN